ncbi:hypothetical protein ZIOFF_026617 [Zingiber officinale]|uniref:UDP-3-O-acyl-N-acetylglucosamine deacetylase n=1 Tax=Zingiber officinale TaxID=94328 RepID=A0A8J5LKM1_ZINOF|nr:hypothetical protein ZIOFF_026617 [Zingiber officinale]
MPYRFTMVTFWWWGAPDNPNREHVAFLIVQDLFGGLIDCDGDEDIKVGVLMSNKLVDQLLTEKMAACATAGWLNPPLRFSDEPCRHKVLDLVGDISLFAQNGNQGLPIAHIIAYKAGHALHADFVRLLSRSSTAQVKD